MVVGWWKKRGHGVRGGKQGGGGGGREVRGGVGDRNIIFGFRGPKNLHYASCVIEISLLGLAKSKISLKSGHLNCLP